MSLSIIPHENDVLMGRGGNAHLHAGNEKLRELARQMCEEYRDSSKKEKSVLSQKLLQRMRELHPPARFLKVNAFTQTWEDVGDKIAREKVSQVLRDAVLALKECQGRKSAETLGSSHHSHCSIQTWGSSFSPCSFQNTSPEIWERTGGEISIEKASGHVNDALVAQNSPGRGVFGNPREVRPRGSIPQQGWGGRDGLGMGKVQNKTLKSPPFVGKTPADFFHHPCALSSTETNYPPTYYGDTSPTFYDGSFPLFPVSTIGSGKRRCTSLEFPSDYPPLERRHSEDILPAPPNEMTTFSPVGHQSEIKTMPRASSEPNHNLKSTANRGTEGDKDELELLEGALLDSDREENRSPAYADPSPSFNLLSPVSHVTCGKRRRTNPHIPPELPSSGCSSSAPIERSHSEDILQYPPSERNTFSPVGLHSETTTIPRPRSAPTHYPTSPENGGGEQGKEELELLQGILLDSDGSSVQ